MGTSRAFAAGTGCHPRTTGPSSTRCCGWRGPERPGATCPSGTARGGASPPGSNAGQGRGCGGASSPRCGGPRMRGDGSPERSTWSMRRACAPTGTRPAQGGPHAQALGRSRGGFGSKLHLRCDRRVRLMAFVLTAGERNERAALPELLARGAVARVGRGRPRLHRRAHAGPPPPARHLGGDPSAPHREAPPPHGPGSLPREERGRTPGRPAERIPPDLDQAHRAVANDSWPDAIAPAINISTSTDANGR